MWLGSHTDGDTSCAVLSNSAMSHILHPQKQRRHIFHETIQHSKCPNSTNILLTNLSITKFSDPLIKCFIILCKKTQLGFYFVMDRFQSDATSCWCCIKQHFFEMSLWVQVTSSVNNNESTSVGLWPDADWRCAESGTKYVTHYKHHIVSPSLTQHVQNVVRKKTINL